MKNFEKYKTTEERVKAYENYCYCKNKDCFNCPLHAEGIGLYCIFNWLELEAEEEKPEPCPFCGGKMQLMFEQNNDTYCLVCNGGCGYTTGAYTSETEAIRWHNRVTCAVIAANKIEVK